MATVKKALRGLANLSIFPVVKNEAEAYSVGERISIPGAQELVSQKDVDEWRIYADDGIFDSGSSWRSSSFTLTLAGLPNEYRHLFEGGSFDEVREEYTFSADSEAPELALSFSSVSGKGQVELTKVYSARCTKVSFDHKTKGDSNAITSVKIEGTFLMRKADGAVFTKKDAAETALSWLDAIEAVGE